MVWCNDGVDRLHRSGGAAHRSERRGAETDPPRAFGVGGDEREAGVPSLRTRVLD